MKRKWIFVLTLVFFNSVLIYADKWLPPQEAQFYSQNDRYQFTVSPKGFNSNDCHGALKNVNTQEMIWETNLINPSAPCFVLISNDAQWVVTLDNWARLGYGDQVIVIYNAEGEMIKHEALEDRLSDEELKAIPCTVSSRWWRKKAELEGHQLILTVNLGEKEKILKIDLDTFSSSLDNEK